MTLLTQTNTGTIKMLTPDQLDRRTVLNGVSLGAGAVVLQPFLNSLAAEARGESPPLRIKRESFGELASRMPAAVQAGPLAEVLA